MRSARSTIIPYRNDPAKAGDSRWVHRPFADWQRYTLRQDESIHPKAASTHGLRRLIELRQSHPIFGAGTSEVIQTGNDHLLALSVRRRPACADLCQFLREAEQVIPANLLRIHGMGYAYRELLHGAAVPFADLTIEPFGFMCLEA